VIRAGAEVAQRGDYAEFLFYAATISVNLAVLNALPLPALDGGQLAFVAAEVLRGGKKIDVRTQENITFAAIFFLLILSFTATAGDVSAAVVGADPRL